MRIPGHDRCFVCGKESEIGLDFTAEGEELCAEFTLSERFQSFEGIVHGGVLASILAEAMGTAVSILERRFLGKKIEVEYHAPVKPRQTYKVCGKVERREGRKIFAKAQIHSLQGTLCAEAKGLFIVLL